MTFSVIKGLIGRVSFVAILVTLFPQVAALPPSDYSIEAVCEVQLEPLALVLSWPRADYVDEYTVRRRNTANDDWTTIATLPGGASGFSDRAVQMGVAYEYELEAKLTSGGYEGDPVRAYSYLFSGANVDRVDSPKAALLLVDASVSGELTSALAVFEEDLLGSGWRVVRRDVSRPATPMEVRNLVRGEVSASPALRSVVLLGRVPVPYSGNIAPDFHDRHRGAWPADAFYGVLEGTWTDHTVSVRSEDSELNDNFPNDGKFDQSDLPGQVSLEIGRIDFSNLPAFAPRTEVDLLRAYLGKNHSFRHRQFTAERRGLVYDGFGDIEGDAPAVDAWRHFGAFFGSGQLTVIGPNEFVPTLSSQSYLWAYGAGGGSFWQADGVGDTMAFAANSLQSVFLILHGSYFGDWNTENNLLRGALGASGMSLAGIWSGVPHWFMHHMALGETIGYTARLTQNNRLTYKSHRNYGAGQVHVALLGDPTLILFPVVPPAGLTAVSDGRGVNLAWSASPDANIVQYRLYHAPGPAGPFSRIATVPGNILRFTHSTEPVAGVYMVRAVKLEKTGSGTFLNASQGVFARPTAESDPTSAISVQVDGTLLITALGRSRRQYQVFASSDASSWEVIASGTSPATGLVQFTEVPQQGKCRFYRIMWP
jgi:hypothetical protein